MAEEESRTPPIVVGSQALEAGSLAREIVQSYEGMIAYYRAWLKRERVGEDDAFGPPFEDDPNHVLEAPPDEVSWFALDLAAQRDPALFEAAWVRIKAEARAELASGHRAARALSPCSRPWERAQFLAIRQSFIDAWQPRGGIELALIDTMAQTHTACLQWLARLDLEARMESPARGAAPERGGPWGPRVSVVEAMERAAAMADRFNRLFLRSLRSLRDLRRYSPSVVVQGSAQINVAERQVNIGQAGTRVDGQEGR